MTSVSKRRISIMLLFCVMLSIFFGCTQEPFIPPTNMSPVETVQFYFAQWNEKNAKGMDSVVRMEGRRSGGGSSNMKYVKLLECVEDKDDTYNPWSVAPGYSQYTAVKVKFEIEFKSKWRDTDGFSPGKSYMGWYFYLAKMDDQSDWVIVDRGS
ncbi:MAG: DUF4829 domain-containing protein [Oscillospiraceae bacterium]|nr:DUF4829 domain-containing protein [Oscillospiraceae bacterium]